mgnify:CR=1 FL=1
MLLLDIAIAIIVIALIYTIYMGYKAFTLAVSFWKKYAAEAEERDRNNEIYYRDFMRS